MIYGSNKFTAEQATKVIAERKLEFPVLFDPKRAYRSRTDLSVYPSATLLDGKGAVVWQGQPYYRRQFADACEAQIKSLLASSKSPKDK